MATAIDSFVADVHAALIIDQSATEATRKYLDKHAPWPDVINAHRTLFFRGHGHTLALLDLEFRLSWATARARLALASGLQGSVVQ